ncbi:MAG: cytochrome c peroxidase [Planctomycetota bacterium]|jgi:cytochrome c peroxidase
MFKLLLRVSLALLVGSSLPFSQAAGGPLGSALSPPPDPVGKPSTEAQELLGKALFWDEQLSSTRTVACGTCHIPSVGGSDPRLGLHPGIDGEFNTLDDVIGSPGVIQSAASGRYSANEDFGLEAMVTGRKAPTMINAAFAPELFWDGRATDSFSDPVTGDLVLASGAALESQAVGPLLSSVEMAHLGRDWGDVVLRLGESEPLALASNLDPELTDFVEGQDYTSLFLAAFGTGEMTPVRIAMAIASYERTLISIQAPVDGPPGSLTPQEARGRQLFNTKGRCNRCHSGSLFTDFGFKNTGVTPIAEDLGRGGITGRPMDNGAFKTPDLRNIELRAPYFHNGSAQSLEEVIDFYDRGGDFHVNQAPAVAPIGFTLLEKADLVAFLKRPMTDPEVAAETGLFARPTLYSESARQPSLYGFGTAASSGLVPRAIAVEPPLLGNSSMTVAVDQAPPVGNAFLLIDLDQGFYQVLGADVLLALGPQLLVVPLGLMQATVQGDGYTSASLQVPSSLSNVGIEVFLQWFVFSDGLSASEGIEVVLF